MYPVLILRAEFVCLVILVFLFFTSREYKMEKDSRAFSRILLFAVVHVIFDIVTVITVNNTETLPLGVNWICHFFFYISAMLYSNEVVNYLVRQCYPQKARRLYGLGHLIISLYICALPFLKIEYVADVGTYSSSGMAAYIGYGIAFTFFIAAIVIFFVNFKIMPKSIKSALLPMMLVLMVTEVSQVVWKSILFTGGAITIVTVGFFFSLENPVTVFQRKAMTDALTGVRSRSSYEEDIEKFDRKFKAAPGDEYTFVFCDLNDLRAVNNQYGHAEGDNYIICIATAINQSVKHADAVYRIGGDEFLIFYTNTDDEIVDRELADIREICEKATEECGYTVAVSAGYARSSPSYKSLKEVVKTADYAMYQNKTAIKNGDAGNRSQGTKYNYTGLTDKMFDAMSVSNDRSYPYITNLETNVTRIAPAWKEYFGLEDEFFNDFNSVWKEKVHPDYLEGYLEDISEVLTGRRKYQNYSYLAKRADGEYVNVTCLGSLYQDNKDGCKYFTGFMVNYGKDDNTDPVTGLKNFDILTSKVCVHMDNGEPFSILKLKLNSFARINMLYGYSGGNEIIKKIGVLLGEIVAGKGEVYCQGAVNFTMLLETGNEAEVEECYNKIRDILIKGIETDAGLVPVHISGGAVANAGERREIQNLRRGLVYALEESHYFRRNQLVFFHDIDAGIDDQEIQLFVAIHRDVLQDMEFFRLRYQPIVETGSGKTVGAEALLRWVHPEFGEVPPGRFIDFFENDPCYYRLGLMIMDQAIRDACEFRKKVPDFRISVNITALQLENDVFADDVCEILDKYNYPTEGLILELTERCKEMDSGFLAAKIAVFRSKGILVALDDMGTGYSTISLLMDIPVDEIKLDKNFVQKLQDNEKYQLFVKSLVLGSSTSDNSYSICFEGVETEEMLNVVSSFGDHLVQGYYFAKPLWIDEFNSRLGSENE